MADPVKPTPDMVEVQPGSPEYNALLSRVPNNGSQSGWVEVSPDSDEYKAVLAHAQKAAPSDSIWDKLGHAAEDIIYPLVGAAAGATIAGAAGVPTGPADIGTAIGGGALGAAAGNELKNAMRVARGRSDLVPQGWGRVSDDAQQAAMGIMQELPGAIKGSKIVGQVIPQVLQDAENMGIKLSPDTKGGRVLSWIVNHLRNSPPSAGLINQTIDKETNQSILNAGRQLADEIAQADLAKDPRLLGNTIAQAAASVQKGASDMYDHALSKIAESGASNIPIKLDDNVQQVARKLLDDLTANRGDFANAFKDAQDRQLAINTLEAFAYPTKITGTVLGPDGKPVMLTRMKELPWNGARQLVSDLSALIRKGDTTLGKGALTQLKAALQDSMQRSLDAANPGLGTAFRNASNNYAQVQDVMSTAVMKHLIDNKSPETAAKFLLANGSAISNMKALEDAIGPKAYPVVRGSILREILNQSTQKANDTLKPQKLLELWNGLGPAAQKVLFPDNAQRTAIEKFMRVADRYAFPIQNRTAGQIAQGGKIGFRVPLTDYDFGFHASPEFVAKLLDTAQGADALAKAVTLPHGSNAQRVAVQTLLQLGHYMTKATKPNTQGNQ